MTTELLRTIDRWRFETPLALALSASAGFFALTVPAPLFAQLPVAGDLGFPGRALVALLLAGVSGGIGYVLMRRAGRPAAPAPVVDEVEAIPEEDRPSGMPPERLARFRRADQHPDAPPRAPIIASRDLGEPFMEVGAFAPPPAAEPAEDWWPETSVPDGDFVEVSETPAVDEPVAPEAPIFEEPVAEAPLEVPPVTAETAAPSQPAQAAQRASIDAMMDRLTAGLERRAEAREPAAADAPAREMAPALRDALDELNRLAERRD